jgi:hypothetical protein
MKKSRAVEWITSRRGCAPTVTLQAAHTSVETLAHSNRRACVHPAHNYGKVVMRAEIRTRGYKTDIKTTQDKWTDRPRDIDTFTNTRTHTYTCRTHIQTLRYKYEHMKTNKKPFYKLLATQARSEHRRIHKLPVGNLVQMTGAWSCEHD